MDSILRDKIAQITARCEILHKKGKYSDAVKLMEEVCTIKKNVLGPQHPQTSQASDKLCQLLNIIAMALLQRQRLQDSLQYLKKAEILAQRNPELKAITLNNMGCYYRKTGKNRTSLNFLIEALNIQLKGEHNKTLADTHINLCAVLSQLSRHDQALKHAMLAIIFLQQQFLRQALPQLLNQFSQERLAVLTIAYHNLGVQFQHIKRAVKIYRKAHNIAEQYIPNNQQLNNNMTKVLESASQQLQNFKKDHKKKVDIYKLEHTPNQLPRVKANQEISRRLTRKSFFKHRPVGRAEGRGRQLISSEQERDDLKQRSRYEQQY